MTAQIIKLWDNLYYHIGTEVNCLTIIVVLFGIMHYMKPRKTPYYAYLQTGVFCSALIGVLDIFMAVIAQNMNDKGAWVLTSAMCVATALYFVCLTNMCLYIIFLLPKCRTQVIKIDIISRIVMTITAVPVFVIYGSHTGMRNDHGILSLESYIMTVTYVTFAALLFIFLFVMYHHKSIAKIVRQCILFFLPLDTLFLLIQHYQMRTMFVSAVATLPLFGMYMFFHSNPFDEIIGCQNTYSMEVRFNENHKDNKPFYFAMLRIPSFLHKNFISDESNDIKFLVDLVRELEAAYKNVHIYRRSIGEFYMIYECGTKDSYEIMRQIGHRLHKKLHHMNTNEKFIMIGIEYNCSVRNISMMMDIMQQAVVKYSNRFGFCSILLKSDEYQDLTDAYYMAEFLEKMRDEKQYDNDNVVCYAQPIYEVESERFKTAEALMRFKIQDKLISPGVFVPIAEANSCIHFLTVCMFHRVCLAICELEKNYEFDAISINVSVQEFSEHDVAEEFLDIIRQYHVSTSKIRLELTESALVTDSNMLAKNMKVMAAAGIQFYLDDFGSGYSSLERLTELPFSVVKFDKSLLYSALKNSKTDRLINGIVPIIQGDNFKALVEGVEDNEQNDYSIKTGFEYIQGYKWAKPVPILQLSDYFEKLGKE